jgi:hypothetical protein
MAKKELSAFEKAFAAARKEKGPNAVFEFNGKKYTTARADDKKELDELPEVVVKERGKAASMEKEDEKMARAQRLLRATNAKRGITEEGAAPTAGRGFRPDADAGAFMGYGRNTDLSRAGGKSAPGYYPMRKGGGVKKYAAGGSVSSASKRADGCAMKGKTKGRFV